MELEAEQLEHKIFIYTLHAHQTIQFAAEELIRYLTEMDENRTGYIIEQCTSYDSDFVKGIWLGLYEELPVTSDRTNLNDQMDDEISIQVANGSGYIAGINERSILLAVYRFLQESGCSWVRPGNSGENIPKVSVTELTVTLQEKAAYRHRGICIEGAVSYENVADIINWAPKAGFNGYFFQFREAYTFFERWYNHQGNPLLKPEGFSVEKARYFIGKAEKEITKRSLLYHAVGHGWTCEPLGIPGLSWDSKEYELSEKVTHYLAEVNGKRAIWDGIPLNTSLCYSHPDVQKLMIDDIVQYAEHHKDVDILHFWLADGSNNQCECENCRDIRPSDFYVRMLNELDSRLTEKKLSTRIVFLVYVDLLWAPEYEYIHHPERFILMFAPITRSYSNEYAVVNTEVELPPFKRNKLTFTSSVDENVAFLHSWQTMFQGDSFDFDYHFMWDHYCDPGYYDIARLLHADIQNLKGIGLNGYVSCQVQRAFFPTGLGMFVMGQTLWNDQHTFEALAEEYFINAFGKEGLTCQKYLSTLSTLFDPPYLRGEKEQINRESVEKFTNIPQVIQEFLPIIARNTNAANFCHAQSWKYLQFHAEYCLQLAAVLEAHAGGHKEQTLDLWNTCKQYMRKHENELQEVFDIFVWSGTMDRKIT